MNDRTGWTIGTLLALAAHAASAQQTHEPQQDVVFYAAGSASVMPLPGAAHIISGAGSVVGEVVVGKPYSAESITETVQVLADGNRIVHTNRARLYRDSEGRTRREHELAAIGPWSPADEPATMIFIDDPVARSSYVLNPQEESVRPLPALRLVRGAPARGTDGAEPGGESGAVVFDRGVAVGVHTQRHVAAGSPGERTEFAAPLPPPGVTTLQLGPPFAGVTTTTEDLGEQVLEGLLTRGRREVQTIPAGAIGNELPIETVAEEWYSDELEAIVLRTTSDPRFGETTYRLVNVVREEPSPDLFMAPEDFETASPGEGSVRFRMNRVPPPDGSDGEE